MTERERAQRKTSEHETRGAEAAAPTVKKAEARFDAGKGRPTPI